MIKPEDFENGMFLALTNNVEAIAQFSVGLGGRMVSLVKVQGVLWIPLNKKGMMEAVQQTALEKIGSAKSIAEMLEIAKAANMVWVGGSV